MKKPIQLSIPTPCHEDWDKMTPDDKGRFCASCQKKVFDFTSSSDREIAMTLKDNDGACGRFLPSQLDRDLTIPADKSSLWPVAAAAISFLSLGVSAAGAQEKVPSEQRSQSNEMMGKALLAVKITGIVTDGSGAVPGVLVRIEGTEISTQTDYDGRYSIDAHSGNQISFFLAGFITQQHRISNGDCNLNINLEEEQLCEVVITSYRSTTRAVSGATYIVTTTEVRNRTFFGRVFHSIGNIFR